MSSITKSIQNEYVLLMENAFSEKYKYAFRNLELKELRRFILKELISSPELDNQLMEVAKGMLRTLIKVTFAYPAIFDEVRQECQINNAHVVAGCGSGYQSVYSRCQSCRTSVRKSSGPG